MTLTPELQKNAPAGSSAKAPSDTLLKNFRATLDTRWEEFDKATMEEAESQTIMGLGARTGRDNHPKFIKAKLAFDSAKGMLINVKNDEELKSNQEILIEVENTLKSLTGHLAELKPDEKSKKMNIILAKTTSDLASFKASITGKEADKKEADVAVAAEKAIPRIAVATTAGVGLGIFSSAEAKGVANEVTGEISQEIKKTLGPWAMIFQGVKDIPTKEVASQMKELTKEYSEKKWTEDPIDKLMAMMALFFLKMQIKRSGIDLSKDMTPEELKLAGYEVKKEEGKKPAEGQKTAKEKGKEALTETVYVMTTSLLVKKGFFEPGSNGGYSKGYNQEQTKKEEMEKQKVVSLMSQPTIKAATYQDILTKKIESPRGYTPENMEKLVMVLKKNESLIGGIVSPHLPNWKNESIETILSVASLYGGFLFQFHQTIDDAKKNVENLDFSKAIHQINLFELKDSPLLQSSLKSTQEKEKTGMTQKVIELTFGAQKDQPISDFKNGGYKGFESTLSSDEQVFMKKLFEYSEKIMPTLYSVLDENGKTALKNMFGNSTKSPKVGQMMALYLLTGGNTELGAMNTGEKLALSLAPLKFATTNDDGAVFATLIQYYSGLVFDGPSFIPKEVQDILVITFKEVRDAALKKLGEYVGWGESAVLKYFQDNPVEAALLIASFAIGGYGAVWFLLRAGKYVAGGLAAALATKYALSK